MRKKSNHISFLKNNDGEVVSNHAGMCNIVRDYFNSVFAGSNASICMSEPVDEHVVTDSQNSKLVAELTYEEFSLDVNQMHPDKASGPDGLNPAFFQHFWKLLGREVFVCCRTWLQECSFPAELNDTNVVLIPKKENADNMRDLRPIALCNVLYKILSKVLANRMKVILPLMISENQSAFVPGRSITDNVLVAFEILHHMKRKNGRGEGEVALKLDVSKAYDRVEWSFLKERMVQMGFSNTWINWIWLCVTTVSYNVCFNGTNIGPITPKRGLRQGDLLSPYLFLLCVEGLSASITKAVNSGHIHGCKISVSAPAVSHLLFADDSFLFFKANSAETAVVKVLLKSYEECSGQSINFAKSGIFFSSNVHVDK